MSLLITFPEPFKIFDGPPGSARWEEEHAHLSFMCPCGCGRLAGVNFKPKYPHGWDWDGNIEKPTVTPSILTQPCGWHGYLTAGAWVSC